MRIWKLLLILPLICGLKLIDENHKNLKNKNNWERIILRNNATFKKFPKVDYGSSFLIRLDTAIIACTAREFIGTIDTYGDMLKIQDFPKQLISWEMYLPKRPKEKVEVESIALQKRVEGNKALTRWISWPFLTFNLKRENENIIPLEPSIEKIYNDDSVYIIGYDFNDNIDIVFGKVELPTDDKFTSDEIRIKTDKFLIHQNYIGAPILNMKGEVIGVFNRAYKLKKNKKGRIIVNKNKNPEGSYIEYFVNGTSMRIILGRKYGM